MDDARNDPDGLPVAKVDFNQDVPPQVFRLEERPPIPVDRKKTPAQSNREWREAMAQTLSFEQKVRVIHMLYTAAVEGDNIPAARELLDRGLGKAGVGSAAMIADDVVASAMTDRLDALTDDELLQYLRLTEKMRQAPVLENHAEDASDG